MKNLKKQGALVLVCCGSLVTVMIGHWLSSNSPPEQKIVSNSSSIKAISGVSHSYKIPPDSFYTAKQTGDLNRRLASLLTVMAQGDNREAFAQANSLVHDYPTFKLAHLIRADLLAARGRLVSAPGEPVVKGDQLVQKTNHLLLEGQKRLKQAQWHPPINKIPDVLVHVSDQIKSAIVVDESQSMIYVFDFIHQKPVLVEFFYTTVGKKGLHKRLEGDQRTPAGVYHFTEHIPIERLDDFYGWGAISTNYPNPWDVKQKRTGHGIWIHGVPSVTYSRSPRESDGCVVLANPELVELFKYIQTEQTPLIIADSINWLNADQWKSKKNEYLQSIEGWHNAYLTSTQEKFYSTNFHNEKQSLSEYIASENSFRKTPEMAGVTQIDMDDLSIFEYPVNTDELPMFYTEFKLSFIFANGKKQFKHKRQYWQKQNNQWKIVHEI